MSNIESGPDNVVTIKVIGVGGAGNNAVDHMVRAGMQGAEFIAINTDKPALSKSSADLKIQIGEKLTKGQGAGANPEIGKKAAEESRNEIAKILENTSMVFVTAGMGGGTGTGAAPIVADIAREAGVLTVGIVTKPFGFEGARRMRSAEEGITNLLGKVDSLLIIPNERLRHISEQKITMVNAYEIADDVLRQAVSSITELVMKTGYTNVDFADVTSIMKDSGYAHMGMGHGSGKTKAEDAIRQAIASPLMETSINGAQAILINFTFSPDSSLEDISEAAELVNEAAHPDALIILGTLVDEEMDDEVHVSIIATKFDNAHVTVTSSPAKPPEPKRTPTYAEPPKTVAPPETAPKSYTQVPKAEEFGVEAPGRSAAPQTAPPVPPEEPDPFDAIAKLFQSK
ncbi:MAG: cell division protein FtsZ [Oscillospiraceae bacterium]|jgi:cell division protein FtsZ|nr:cell division protein FtsZ [Oscillospiraceae bacterium]